mmetsp:Transcript_86111/g.230571  ORF Transcript_86111/g.230571 Transcript_86111/m.230571 type:complete len:238 (+) Transcript_86111:172-885(+)
MSTRCSSGAFRMASLRSATSTLKTGSCKTSSDIVGACRSTFTIRSTMLSYWPLRDSLTSWESGASRIVSASCRSARQPTLPLTERLMLRNVALSRMASQKRCKSSTSRYSQARAMLCNAGAARMASPRRFTPSPFRPELLTHTQSATRTHNSEAADFLQFSNRTARDLLQHASEMISNTLRRQHDAQIPGIKFACDHLTRWRNPTSNLGSPCSSFNLAQANEFEGKLTHVASLIVQV